MSNKQTIMNITGANYRGDRHEHDFYATPSEVTQSLLNELYISKRNVIWEPCAGTGAISKVIHDNGYDVISTDLIYRDFPADVGVLHATGEIYDATTINTSFANIVITNPPFNLAEKILVNLRKLKLTTIALLLKSSWLQAGVKRGWIMDEYPPTDIYALSWRPDFTNKGAPTGEMSWFVWQEGIIDGETRYYLLRKP